MFSVEDIADTIIMWTSGKTILGKNSLGHICTVVHFLTNNAS